MLRYVALRLLLSVPTLWAVLTLVFVLVRVVPGDPALVILEGMTLGYLSSVWSVLMVVAALVTAVLAFSIELPDALKPIALYGGIAAAIGLFIWRGLIKRNLMGGIFYATWGVVAGLFLYRMAAVESDAT